ncbi:uncharacterized protein DUF2550 [Rhodococcus sp. SMB37]|nr:uncharacterized protein DUF2550 [Rhodococcus sp. SMB37]
MSVGMIVLIILVVLLAASVAAFLFRFSKLRRGGTAAIVRVMPRADGAGWRHGIIRYGDNTLVFYKLSSIKPGPDSRMSRQGIEVRSRRAPEGSEFDIMTDDIVILEIVDNAATYEVALDSGARTAFLSWLESRPDERSQRRRLG